MNYFATSSAANRYAQYRPYSHPLAISEIAAVTGRVRRALDVGCGTGQSAVALTDIAAQVDAVDIAQEMLQQAEAHPRVTLHLAPAEALPFADGSFDLVATGLAYHWFDQPAFLREADRVLESGGWLAIYNDSFTGIMVGNPAYEAWNETYLARFPSPPRNLKAASPEDWARRSFVHVKPVRFSHDVAMTLEEWCGYLTTQSNVIAAIEQGRDTIASAGKWIKEGLKPLFNGDVQQFRFYCVLDVYRTGRNA